MNTNSNTSVVLLSPGVDYRGLWHNTSPRFAAKPISGQKIQSHTGPGYWNPKPVTSMLIETPGAIELWGADHNAAIMVENLEKPIALDGAEGILPLGTTYYYTVTVQDNDDFWCWPPIQKIGKVDSTHRGFKIKWKTSDSPKTIRLLRGTVAGEYFEYYELPLTNVNFVVDDGNLSYTAITTPAPPTKSNMEFGGFTNVGASAFVAGNIYPFYLYKYYGTAVMYGMIPPNYPMDAKKHY